MEPNLRTKLTHHFVDTTGNLVASTPILAGLDLLVGVPEDISLKSRYLGIATGLLGMQYLTRIIRNYSRKQQGITTKSKESTQHSHDRLNASMIALVSSPFSYLIAEQFSNEDVSNLEILVGTLTRASFGYLAGGIATYSEHGFRDLLCEKKHERIPREVYTLKKSERIALATMFTAGSIALTYAMYYLHPN